MSVDIKLNYKNADETLAKIREVLTGIEAVKRGIREMAQMEMELELATSVQGEYLPEDEDTQNG